MSDILFDALVDFFFFLRMLDGPRIAVYLFFCLLYCIAIFISIDGIAAEQGWW